MDWLSLIPDWASLLLFIALPAAGAIALHAVIRRFLPAKELLPHHDVAGFLVAIVGVLYAVVLGFVVVTVWSNFDSVQRTADLEAGAVGDAYAFARMLPEPPRTRTEKAIVAYAVEVHDVEWPDLRQGHSDPKARELLVAAIEAVANTPAPRTHEFADALRNEAVRQSVLNGLRDVADNRRLRIIQSRDAIPAALYLALVMGAVMVLAFVYLFGVERAELQFAMTGIVAGCIGLLFGVIVAFDAPFAGAIRVSPEAWTMLIQTNGFDAVNGVRPPPLTAP
jgi:hypothetical protein